MGRDVFVCHASEDADVATRAVAALEERGVTCWIAPRDVAVGASYMRAIVEAIDGCRLFLFLHSSHSDASGHVARELERAVARGVGIVPVRLDATTMGQEAAYAVGSLQWFDATGGLSPPRMAALAEQVSTTLGRGSAVPARRSRRVTPTGRAPVAPSPSPAPGTETLSLDEPAVEIAVPLGTGRLAAEAQQALEAGRAAAAGQLFEQSCRAIEDAPAPAGSERARDALVGVLHAHAAEAYGRIGDAASRRRASASALPRLEAAVEAFPDSLGLRHKAMVSAAVVGWAAADAGDFGVAIPSYRRARHHADLLARMPTTDRAARSSVAAIQAEHADVLRRGGRLGESEKAYERATESLQALLREGPIEPTEVVRLATVHHGIGLLRTGERRLGEALDRLEAAVDTLALLRDGAGPAGALVTPLWRALKDLEQEFQRDKDSASQLRMLRVSIRLVEACAAAWPAQSFWRYELSNFWTAVGKLRAAARAPTEARDAFARAATALRQLVAKGETLSPGWREQLRSLDDAS